MVRLLCAVILSLAALTAQAQPLVFEAEDVIVNKDALLYDKSAPDKWNVWSTDKDADKKWSGGVTVQSPPVMEDRATPEEGAPPLHIVIPDLPAGSYIVTLKGGRDLGISLDGREWKRLSELGWRLGRVEAEDGKLEFWLDDRYAQKDNPGFGYADTITLTPAMPETMGVANGGLEFGKNFAGSGWVFWSRAGLGGAELVSPGHSGERCIKFTHEGERDYVLTNRHVIDGATPQQINITLADGRPLQPTQVWTDVETDVAVMAVDAPGLVAAELGEDTPLEIGDFVLAMGSPFGLSHSVTFGIISAKGRRDLQLGNSGLELQDFLQTDAAINPGNSGGPLINLRGQVIGINTAIASNSGGNEGIGFAIPVNMFMKIAEQLIETGVVTRAFLGVNLNSKFGPAMAAELGLPRRVGAHISAVTPDSPAEKAQLQVGDVILEFDGAPVEDDAHLVNMVSLTEVGKKVQLLVFRDRRPISVTVEVGDRSKFEQ